MLKQKFRFYDYIFLLLIFLLIGHFFFPNTSSLPLTMTSLLIAIISTIMFIVDMMDTDMEKIGVLKGTSYILGNIVILGLIAFLWVGGSTMKPDKSLLVLERYTDKRVPLKPIGVFNDAMNLKIVDSVAVIHVTRRQCDVIQDSNITDGRARYQVPLCSLSGFNYMFWKEWHHVYDDGTLLYDTAECRDKFKIKLFVSDIHNLYEKENDANNTK